MRTIEAQIEFTTGERIVDRFDDWTAGQVFLAKMDVLGGMSRTSHSSPSM